MSLKNIKLQARVTEKEYERILRMAKKGGYKNLSEYLRDKIVNKEIIEYDFGDINERLAKLGGELNQLVILCHKERIDIVDVTGIAEEIELLRKLLKKKL